jgi:hypothetical protein
VRGGTTDGAEWPDEPPPENAPYDDEPSPDDPQDTSTGQPTSEDRAEQLLRDEFGAEPVDPGRR